MFRTGIPDTLAGLAVPIATLVPYQDNPRRGDVDTIAASLSTNGQYRPIVVRRTTNQVLAGNHTLAAAQQLGWTHIAATYVECSDEEAARIVLVDNRTNDRGAYDDEVLIDLLRSLTTLEGTGYDPHDLDALIALRETWDGDLPADDLQGALDAADASMWPWVRVQLPPDVYARFMDTPGADEAAKIANLLQV